MTLHVGGQAVGEVYVGADPIAEGWLWDGSAWSQVYRSAPPFTGARLDKAGTQTLAAVSTWYAVEGWTPAAGVIVENEGVRVPEGVTVNVTGSAGWGHAPSFVQYQRIRVVNGASVVVAGEKAYNGANPLVVSGSFVGTGEVVRLEAQVTQTGTNRDTVTAAGTYLELAVA